MNKKRMKKTVIIFSIIISIIAIFICFTVIYNEVAKPFEHKTYYSGKEKNCDEIMKMPFYEEYVKNKFD